MEEKKEKCDQGCQKGGFVKGAVLFLGFFALVVCYYLTIDYVMMVFAQNLPFPYKG